MSSPGANVLKKRLTTALTVEWACLALFLYLASNDEMRGALIALASAIFAKLVVCWHVASWASLTRRNAPVYVAGTLLIKIFGDPLIPLCAIYSLRKLAAEQIPSALQRVSE